MTFCWSFGRYRCLYARPRLVKKEIQTDDLCDASAVLTQRNKKLCNSSMWSLCVGFRKSKFLFLCSIIVFQWPSTFLALHFCFFHLTKCTCCFLINSLLFLICKRKLPRNRETNKFLDDFFFIDSWFFFLY